MLVQQCTSGYPGSNGRVVYLAQAGDCIPNPLFSDPASTAQCSGGPRLLADADVASYDADGFTLNWTTNDVTNTNDIAGDEQDAQIFYAAFGNESTTEVTLSSFTARADDSAVGLEWETASELDNLGFHLYRSVSRSGPWTRITSSLIPGLGSSPIGARYSYTDTGLTNGVLYHYQLEDVETTGRTERHGPVSATPMRGDTRRPGGRRRRRPDPGTEPEDGGSNPGVPTRVTYGDPSSVSLRVVRRDSTGVDLELLTGGLRHPDADGSVRLEIPGFELHGEPGTPPSPSSAPSSGSRGSAGGHLRRALGRDVLLWPRPPSSRHPSSSSAATAPCRRATDGSTPHGSPAGPTPPRPPASSPPPSRARRRRLSSSSLRCAGTPPPASSSSRDACG
jgi:hypothetical protein